MLASPAAAANDIGGRRRYRRLEPSDAAGLRLRAVEAGEVAAITIRPSAITIGAMIPPQHYAVPDPGRSFGSTAPEGRMRVRQDRGRCCSG